MVAMARQDLKKYCMHPHVLTLDNISDPVLWCVAHSCEWLTAHLLLTLWGCIVVHCNLRVESSSLQLLFLGIISSLLQL
jgi:hypothetical protein